MAETNVRQEIADKIKDSNNILVTVSANPSVDELSAALGMTLLINKLDKHATAVFSGEVPAAIDFLEPGKTFENTVDSLRDFIIALDKEKADHLRYKVDGDVVKIFITPYRTTITQDDFDFSQGDYNVEFVLAVGVKNEDDLDTALSAHGRILHDATVAAVNVEGGSSLGTISWVDTEASSYSELLAGLASYLKKDKKLIDEQIATAFLTGIVAATDRFSNDKTSSRAMTVAAELMSAGANQQLIASQLEDAHEIGTPSEDSSEDKKDTTQLTEGESTKVRADEEMTLPKPKEDDAGALAISHEPTGTADEVASQVAAEEQRDATDAAKNAEAELIKQTEDARKVSQDEAAQSAEDQLAAQLTQATPPPLPEVPSMETPVMGGTLNATTEQAALDKQKELEDTRNRTILSHARDPYVSDAPQFQSPLNSAAAAQEEPSVPDVLSQPPAQDTHVADIQPVGAVPTPQSDHASALDAVHASYEEAPIAPPQPTSFPPLPPQPGIAEVPPLPPTDFSQTIAPPPPPPSMPDFSTLPPPPPMPPMPVDTGGVVGPLAAPETTDFSMAPPSGSSPVADTPSVPDTLGEILPPAPITADATASVAADPAQFRIPGQ